MFKSLRHIISLIVLLTVFLPGQSPVRIDEIKNSLICNCGCSMTVAACEGAMTCGTASGLTEEARGLIDRGLTKDEILAAFVNRYGEEILSAPTKSGFNLLAWVMPFLVLGSVGAGLVTLIRKWAGQTKPPSSPRQELSTAAKPGDEFEQQLDDILQNIE